MANDSITQRYINKEALITEAITDRYFYAESVTDRWFDAVTDKFIESANLMAVLKLQAGTIIADNYRIQQGLLQGRSGEAEIYLCWDESLSQQVVVKLYRYQFEPKQQVLKKLLGLKHPNIVHVFGFGHWLGRFYEVMEYCRGGTLIEQLPLTTETLQQYLPPLLQALNYCHQQGIIHRDIKPSNLLFRDHTRTEPVLGDFGISSILGEQQQTQITKTAANLTLDYAAPELLDGHTVGFKTDYYALGITLIHLLMGQSPFQGMTTTDVLVSHLRGRMIWPQNLPQQWRQLLQGLLQLRPENRWAYTQVSAWLAGDIVTNDERKLWHAEKPKVEKKIINYPGYPKASNPQQLAAMLEEFPAEKQLYRGDIRRWVFDYFSTELAEQIEQIEERYTSNPSLGLVKLKYLLDPNQPLAISHYRITTISELIKLLDHKDKEVQHQIREVQFNGALATWLEHLPNVANKEAILANLKAMKHRLLHKQYFLGLFALRYTLNPQPLALTSSISIAHPKDLEQQLQQHPALESHFMKFVQDERLEEWIQAVRYVGWEQDLRFIQDCRQRYPNQVNLLANAIRWYYQPTRPFHFMGQYFDNPKQLATAIDNDNDSLEKGLHLLKRGWIRAWLVSTGRVQDIQSLDAVLEHSQSDWRDKMETILHYLDPDLASPQLTSDRQQLLFNKVRPDRPKTQSVSLWNQGRGYLSGHISLETMDTAMTISPSEIHGEKVIVKVSVHTIGLIAGHEGHNKLMVRTNGGQLEIPIYYQCADEKSSDNTMTLNPWLATAGGIILLLFIWLWF